MNQKVFKSGKGREQARWALFVAGMAFFWPTVSLYRLNPGALVAGEGTQASVGDSIGAGDLAWALTTLAGALALGLLGLRKAREGEFAPQRALPHALVVSEMALVACLVAGVFVPGASENVACQVVTGVAVAAYLLALCCSWARVSDTFADEARLLVALLASFILTVPLVWAAQEAASLARITTSGGEALLTLVSGPLCLASLHLASRERPGARAQQSAGCLRQNAGPVLAMWATVVVYLLFTTVLRIVSMVGLEPDETLTKSPTSKVMLALFGAVLLGSALLLNRNADAGDKPGRTARYPWVPFVALCLAVLYASIAFFQVSPWLCREVIFPSRMCADALLFLLAVAAARRAGTSAAPLACLLFPTVIAVQRLVFVGTYGWASGLDGGTAAALVLPMTAATALVTTACTALYAWQALSRRGGHAALEEVSAPAPGSDDGRPARSDVCRTLGKEFSLTDRELQVLELLSAGYGQKGVAAELGLTTNTVHSYTKSLYAKTGIHSRQEAVDLVNRRGR